LPKLPPGRTRLACSTRSLVGSMTVWTLIVQFLTGARLSRDHA
jgi:hypothetical protein